jgi:hypothetical protein
MQSWWALASSAPPAATLWPRLAATLGARPAPPRRLGAAHEPANPLEGEGHLTNGELVAPGDGWSLVAPERAVTGGAAGGLVSHQVG